MNFMNVYLEEYSANEAVQKYVSDSAGSGIAYLLQHVYGRIYEQQIDKLVTQSGGKAGFRILEYGCGGGMNLIWIVRHLLDRQLKLDFACGTDFSAKMVEAAKKEASSSLPRTASDKVFFRAVANENLNRDLPNELGRSLADLQSSFDLIVGVNTFRYCFRLASQAEVGRRHLFPAPARRLLHYDRHEPLVSIFSEQAARRIEHAKRSELSAEPE